MPVEEPLFQPVLDLLFLRVPLTEGGDRRESRGTPDTCLSKMVPLP